MEIRISLDRAEPPAGRLWLLTEPGQAAAAEPPEHRFSGWLGLLRALYEVVGPPER